MQLSYNKWISKEVHSRNMNVGLKNNLGLIQQLKVIFLHLTYTYLGVRVDADVDFEMITSAQPPVP